MSESGPYTRGHNHSPSYNSAETGGTTLADPHDPNTINLSAMTPPDSPPLSKTSMPRGTSAYESRSDFGRKMDVNNIGKAIASRVVRTARRGNLPFLLVFLSCLVYFFAALAGIGYVDPDTLPSVPGSAPILANAPAPAVFIPGVPIFDPNEDSEVARRRKHEERKELEKEWQKMKRPKDGAWMRKQRDDKAVRRVPVKAPEPVLVEKYADSKD